MLPLPTSIDGKVHTTRYSPDYWHAVGWNDLAIAWEKISRGKFAGMQRLQFVERIERLCNLPVERGPEYSMGNEWYFCGIEDHYLDALHGKSLPEQLVRYHEYLPLLPWKNHRIPWAHVCKTCHTIPTLMVTCTGGICFDTAYCSEACAQRMLDRRVREDSELRLASTKKMPILDLTAYDLDGLAYAIQGLPGMRILNFGTSYLG